LHSQLPELSLRDLAAAATEQAVQGHINAAFAALQERLNTGVGMLCQQLSTQQPGRRSSLTGCHTRASTLPSWTVTASDVHGCKVSCLVLMQKASGSKRL
jgi:hypothetical protein